MLQRLPQSHQCSICLAQYRNVEVRSRRRLSRDGWRALAVVPGVALGLGLAAYELVVHVTYVRRYGDATCGSGTSAPICLIIGVVLLAITTTGLAALGLRFRRLSCVQRDVRARIHHPSEAALPRTGKGKVSPLPSSGPAAVGSRELAWACSVP